jgi:very-short-patch-repair endonuclease
MNRPFHHEASPRIFKNAKSLRKTMTPAEVRLWKCLRDRKFKEHKFRRQHPVASYIVDFYSHRSSLVIEIDGGIHNSPESQIYDAERTKLLESLELKVIRFTNDEILHDLESVLNKIEKHLISFLPSKDESFPSPYKKD